MKKLLLSFLIISMMLASFGMVSADTLFEDDFETGVISGDWFQAGDPVITSNLSYVNNGVHAVVLDGGVDPDDLIMSVTIDTTDYKNIELSYSRLLESLESDNGFMAEYSVNSGGSWTTLENVYGTEPYDDMSYTLSPSADDLPGLVIKFSVYGGATNDLAALDDVLVTGDESIDPVITMDVQPEYPMCSSGVNVCATVTDDSEIDFVDITCTAGNADITHSDVSLSGGSYCSYFSAESMRGIEDGILNNGDNLICSIEAEDVHGNNDVQDQPNPLATYDCENPIADAGADQTVEEGSVVTFDGTGSTDSVTPSNELEYSWNFGDGSAIETGINLIAPTHIYADNGIYTFTLIVKDNVDLIDDDEMIVTVTDLTPTANAGSDDTINEGQTIDVDGSSSTGNAYDLISLYEWDFSYDGSNFNAEATGVAVTSPIYEEDGTYTVALRVTDEDSYDIDTFTLTVNDVDPTANAGARSNY